ncbi:MAG: selenium cofactor biosynthesis protein YqeC [Gammaproteobacteria bacterium]
MDVLAAQRGVVCLVGAGGKKTTMYALAEAHPGRVALSSTSHMYLYDERRVDAVVRLPGDAPPPSTARVVAFAGRTETRKRVGGLDAATLQAIRDRGEFDLIVLKADGARARWIKAPQDYEPLIPAFADTVIPVVSARAIGRRLDEGIAHRPERAAAVMHTRVDAPLEPLHLARLLASPDGALKGVGDALVRPLINMVDGPAELAAAREAADLALAMTVRFDRVVLAAMKGAGVVEVVRRAA